MKYCAIELGKSVSNHDGSVIVGVKSNPHLKKGWMIWWDQDGGNPEKTT